MREPGTCHHSVPLMAWCNACAIENVEAKKREAKDAARYRWLRDIGADTIIMKKEVCLPSGTQMIHVKLIGWTELDKAIDAALASDAASHAEEK